MLSIIVPIYNTEKYIIETLDSLLEQKYKDVEVLLVDDGSTDKSGKLCDEFCLKHNQFKTYHKANGGVSSARNFGLDVSSGEYIAFVDSDDLVDPWVFDRMMSEAQNGNYDIVQCDFLEGPNCKSELNHLLIDKELSGGLETTTCLFEPNKLVFNSVCGKVFKKELIADIRFNEEIRIAEDLLFTFFCCLKASKVKILSYKGYIYIDRTGSAMRSTFSKKRFDDFKVNDLMLNCIETDEEMIRKIYRRDAKIAFECYYSASTENLIYKYRKFLVARLKKSKCRYSLGIILEISIFMILHFPTAFELCAKMWYRIKRLKQFQLR